MDVRDKVEILEHGQVLIEPEAPRHVAGVRWVMLFCFPLMAAIQEISARMGRVTGQGIAGNIRAHYSSWRLCRGNGSASGFARYDGGMTISFALHQFPPAIILHAVWLYVRFTLRYRDVEDLLAERGLDVSYETVRRWALKFGPLFPRELRRRRPRPTPRWHLDEMGVVIAGRQFWLWRAVDDEGEVLDLLVQQWRDKAAAVKLMRKLLKRQGFAPDVLVTDKLRSYGAARSEIGLSARNEQGLRKNNRAWNSHQPTRRREQKMQLSNRLDQPSASCPFTPPFTTRSTSNVISHPAARFAS